MNLVDLNRTEWVQLRIFAVKVFTILISSYKCETVFSNLELNKTHQGISHAILKRIIVILLECECDTNPNVLRFVCSMNIEAKQKYQIASSHLCTVEIASLFYETVHLFVVSFSIWIIINSWCGIRRWKLVTDCFIQLDMTNGNCIRFFQNNYYDTIPMRSMTCQHKQLIALLIGYNIPLIIFFNLLIDAYLSEKLLLSIEYCVIECYSND